MSKIKHRPRPKHGSKKQRELKQNQWLNTFIIGVGVFFILRITLALIFTTTIVNGPSMSHTLHTGQELLINKLSKGSVGDIIALNANAADQNNPYLTHQTYYIKRIIAQEGDTVKSTEEGIEVNGSVLYEPYLSNENQAFTENWSISQLSTNPRWNSSNSETIPQDYYFVLGDNRKNSEDSRTFGYVHKDHIIGKAYIYPWDQHLRIKREE